MHFCHAVVYTQHGTITDLTHAGYLRLVTRINSRALKTPVAIILSLPDTPECMLPGTENINMAT